MRSRNPNECHFHLAEILKIRIVKQIPIRGLRPYWFLLEMNLLVHRGNDAEELVLQLSGERVYEMLTHLVEFPSPSLKEAIRQCEGRMCVVCLNGLREIRGIFCAREFSVSWRRP